MDFEACACSEAVQLLSLHCYYARQAISGPKVVVPGYNRCIGVLTVPLGRFCDEDRKRKHLE